VVEAYDPAKREIYDVYGLQGLRSGLQVGAKLRGGEDLRRAWARFRAEREERKIHHKGVSVMNVDATPLLWGVLKDNNNSTTMNTNRRRVGGREHGGRSSSGSGSGSGSGSSNTGRSSSTEGHISSPLSFRERSWPKASRRCLSAVS